jgi:hypothetical protein
MVLQISFILILYLYYSDTSPNSPNKYRIRVWYGCASNTMRVRIRYVTWCIRLFYSLWPADSVSDTPWYFPIRLWYALIHLQYTLICLQYAPICCGYNWISCFSFILFTLKKLSRIFFFFIITEKVTNSSQILQNLFIIIKQIIFYISYKKYFIIIYSRTCTLYFLFCIAAPAPYPI